MADDARWMAMALDEARAGLDEGGVPVGSVLVIDGQVVGRGRNRRVQQGNPILHGEMDCLQNAGRLRAEDYRRATLYTSLCPCWMCTGAILLFGIPRVVMAENDTFRGPEQALRDQGVELVDLDLDEAKELMRRFQRDHPQVWAEDIGT